MKKATTKFQLIRDGEPYGTVYDLHRDAIHAGDLLVSCGWIREYQVVPIKAIWLKA